MTTKNNNSQLYYKESVGFNKEVKENSRSRRNLKLLLQHQINDKNDKNINNYYKKHSKTNIDKNNNNSNNNNDSDHYSGDNNSDNNNINESKDTDNNKSRQHYSSEFIKDWLHKFLDLKLQRLENNLEITNDQIRIELNKTLQVNIKSSTVSRIINKVMKGRNMKKIDDDDDDDNNRSNIRDGQTNFMDDRNDHNIDDDHNDSSEYNSIGQSLKDDADDDYIVIGKKKYGKYLFVEKVNQIHHLELLKKDKNDLIKAQKFLLKEHKKGMKRKCGDIIDSTTTTTTSIVPTSTTAIGDMSSSSNQLMLHNHLHPHEFNHDGGDDDDSDDNCNITNNDNDYYHNNYNHSSSVLLIPDQYHDYHHDQQELNNHINSKIIKTKRHHYSSEFVTKWLNKFLELKADSHLNKTSLTHHQARLILNDYFNVEIKPATANRFIHKLTKSSRNEVYHRRGRKINIDFEVEVLNELIRTKNREGNYLNVVGEYISCTYECFRIAGKIVQSYEKYQDDNGVQRLQFSDHWVENLIQRYQSNRLRCITDEGNIFIIGDGIHGNYCLDIKRRQENVRFIDIYLCDYVDDDDNADHGNINQGDNQDGNDDDDDTDDDNNNNNDDHKKGKKNIKGRNVSTTTTITTSHVRMKKQKKQQQQQHDSSVPSMLMRKSSSSSSSPSPAVTRRQVASSTRTSRRHEKYAVSDHKNEDNDDAINFNKDNHSDKIDIVVDDDDDDSDDSEDDK
jgi:hypothetical protein